MKKLSFLSKLKKEGKLELVEPSKTVHSLAVPAVVYGVRM